ncbi:antibiotic resistance protein MarC [Sulfolobus sp. A20]|uniref:MarC family protein n=1 Tax=Sulfolobaceae TaxID=118883 RepID=UPI000845EF86|nr:MULTISPECIES: MarC family protein [unclassified Sulfolobus]TRM76478.1 MarC family protein [Sulfolobus sp. E5]TRM76709.1 MarC family protein [Sulfolobus sp. A20-N-F8]TRM76911.1 MarC family protein [Sulfolobus sp. B5]TRM87752.1 MarC family protein [Sulfolobus sp. C3]TRM93360.1 MarC family protein [Sulfolobus sp. A20-N-G8]TRN00246.1 MarC family protein [Sulfolobus sp. E1]
MINIIAIPEIAFKLYAIMDPLSILPYLIALYEEFNRNSQTKVGWNFLVNKISIAVVALLIFFSILGGPLLAFLGISTSALEIGGGIVLVYLGVDTLGGFQQLKFLSSRIEEAIVTPIATPLIVGPGTMTALITLSVNNNVIVLIVGSLLASLLVYLSLLLGPVIIRVLGNTGTVAAGRFMAIIIAAFGVQLILNGISQIKLI